MAKKKQADEPKPPMVHIVFGGVNTLRELGDNAIHTYVFATQAEMDAFLQGVAAMDGWNEYEQFDDYKAAQAHVAEYADEEQADAG